ncbi:lysophospholipid acyltransferase family protein [Stratiformator vulcanicus]|uniref:2-acyl-glycerophospho-ethanolamine acyltransferase n=1 Tax=Stratiformator vulcanicus TaxID=2527980 RepID=A0A517R6H3_9PLAN|nr:lysophospholipid acyltransferase family protein [Stratiformator vulcanicus]QDT39504.1 2-acyl-glycerophospho-ethanolamine acyltransferase [Stratiformator vulcanicus]
MINNTLRYIFFLCIVRPVVLLLIGVNVRNIERLPGAGPALLVANHNSHLDTMVLISLFGMKRLHLVRPVAAADHFLRNAWLTWFSKSIIGIIPIERTIKSAHRDPLKGVDESLGRDEIVILFPEGSRGEPEVRETFKTGVAHIARRHPDVPLTPVFLHGLGRALPKGEGVLVPFFCDCFIGKQVPWDPDRDAFMHDLERSIEKLSHAAHRPDWEKYEENY